MSQKTMGYVFATDNGKKAVQGRIQRARATLWIGDQKLREVYLPVEQAPRQINNMTLWYQLAAKLLMCKEYREFLQRGDATQMESLLNNGLGVKEGRDSNTNTFSFIHDYGELGKACVVVTLESVRHQALWHREHGKEYMAQRRAATNGLGGLLGKEDRDKDRDKDKGETE